MSAYWCGNGCAVDMEYIGDGDWECPKCGKVICFGEPDDEDDSEYISVWDTADIYFSSGCDEDNMFGYSESELRRAHNG